MQQLKRFKTWDHYYNCMYFKGSPTFYDSIFYSYYNFQNYQIFLSYLQAFEIFYFFSNKLKFFKQNSIKMYFQSKND